MGQNWLRSMMSGRSDSGAAKTPAPPTPASPVPAERAEAPAAVPAAAVPAAAAPAASAEEKDLTAVLERSLAWRAKVLLGTGVDERPDSDARQIVDLLLTKGAPYISQPPAAALRALEMVRDPDASVGQTVELFESDPMLAQSLLKTANSAYYRVGEDRLVAIGGALQRVGTNVTEGLLMAATVEKMLCRPGGAFDNMVRMTWSHMQRTAPIARDLARHFGVAPDTAYSLALLHDVGKLVIFESASALRRRKRRDLELSETFCRHLLMHLHEPLGGLAMLRWGMGDLAAHAVGGHHRRPIPEGTDAVTEMLYVAEAIEIAHARGEQLDLESVWARGGITAERADAPPAEDAA
jgi:HD-like signal output (HDOD) protein